MATKKVIKITAKHNAVVKTVEDYAAQMQNYPHVKKIYLNSQDHLLWREYCEHTHRHHAKHGRFTIAKLGM